MNKTYNRTNNCTKARKGTIILALVMLCASIFSVMLMTACDNSDLEIDFDAVAAAFRQEGFIVAGPTTHLGITSLSATNIDGEQFWLFRYTSNRERNAGRDLADLYVQDAAVIGIDMRVSWDGFYVWYGTSLSLEIFDQVRYGNWHWQNGNGKDLDFAAYVFGREGYTVAGPFTILGITSFSATTLENQFHIFRYSNQMEADFGWDLAGTFINGFPSFTRHRQGFYVWYGSPDAIAIFNRIMDGTWTPPQNGNGNVYFAVYFVLADVGDVVYTAIVRAGNTTTPPPNPTREGYIFSYWGFMDGPFDFESTPIVSDIILFAIWQADTVSSDIDLDFVAYAFDKEGYTVVGPTTILTTTSLSAATLENQFHIFRYSNQMEADIGWDLAAGFLVSFPLWTRHRQGFYVWYGSAEAVNLFNRIIDGRWEPPPIAFVYISANSGNAIALDASGRMWNVFSEKSLIENAENVPLVQAVSVGGNFAAAVCKLGFIYTWGTGNEGQLGNGLPDYVGTPIRVTTGHGGAVLPQFKAISAGYRHTLAICVSGNIWTWGVGSSYVLGHGTTANELRPRRIVLGYEGAVLPIFDYISAGPHSHNLALCTNGNIWSWGAGGNGQMGHGDWEVVDAPRRILTDYNGENLPAFISISAGSHFNTAVCENGFLWSWGGGDSGELGLGQDITLLLRPHRVGNQVGGSLLPVIVSISSGGGFSLAICEEGSVWSFGVGNSGQLGHGWLLDEFRPRPIESVAGFNNIEMVAADSSLSWAICGAGRVWRWGSGQTRPQIVEFGASEG